MLETLNRIAMPSRQILAGCILLALFIGSVVYEALATRPQRHWLALVAGVASGVLMFVLLVLLLR